MKRQRSGQIQTLDRNTGRFAAAETRMCRDSKTNTWIDTDSQIDHEDDRHPIPQEAIQFHRRLGPSLKRVFCV